MFLINCVFEYVWEVKIIEVKKSKLNSKCVKSGAKKLYRKSNIIFVDTWQMMKLSSKLLKVNLAILKPMFWHVSISTVAPTNSSFETRLVLDKHISASLTKQKKIEKKPKQWA